MHFANGPGEKSPRNHLSYWDSTNCQCKPQTTIARPTTRISSKQARHHIRDWRLAGSIGHLGFSRKLNSPKEKLATSDKTNCLGSRFKEAFLTTIEIVHCVGGHS
eukprot:2495684-Amphidinium_carterae.1